MFTYVKAAMALSVLVFSLFTVAPASAEDGPSAWPEWTCGTFPGTTEEAIDYYAEFGGPATLDPDGDGIACNEGTAGEGPSAWPEFSCHTWPGTVDQAAEYFLANGGPAFLDADGDGMPCEPNGDDEVTECRDLTGPQGIAQEYYEANGMPRNLDLDQDGMACVHAEDGYWGDEQPRPASLPNEDEEVAATDDPATADESGEAEIEETMVETESVEEPDSAVVSLPNTGAGAGASDATTPLGILAIGAMVLSVLAASILRTTRH